jgi:hypothetical protein
MNKYNDETVMKAIAIAILREETGITTPEAVQNPANGLYVAKVDGGEYRVSFLAETYGGAVIWDDGVTSSVASVFGYKDGVIEEMCMDGDKLDVGGVNFINVSIAIPQPKQTPLRQADMTKSITLNAKEAKALTKNIEHAFRVNYFDGIPLSLLKTELLSSGYMLMDEDGSEWEGIFCGNTGRTVFKIAKHISTNIYIPVDNRVIVFTWYAMGNGRMEIVCYLS